VEGNTDSFYREDDKVWIGEEDVTMLIYIPPSSDQDGKMTLISECILGKRFLF